MLNNAITKKQKQVYEYVASYISEHGVAPTVREVANHRNTTVSNVQRYLDSLHKNGWISKGVMKTRGIVLGPETKRPIVYLATPYSFGGDTSPEQRQENYRIATRAAWELFSAGLNVYSPIVHHHNIQAVTPIELTTEQWMEFDLPFLQSSHTLYVLCTMNWDKSEGVVAEINYAKDNSKKIEYIEPTPFVLYGEDIDC